MASDDKIKFAAQIMGNLSAAERASALAAIRDSDPALARSIEERIVSFEALAELDSRSLQRLLKEAGSTRLSLALKGLAQELVAKFCNGLSRRAAEELQEDIENLGQVRLSDVEAERQKIVKIAVQMAGRGEIILPGGDDRMIE